MKKAFIITVSILSCVILVLGIVLFNSNNALTQTSASLESVYQRSFYDLVSNVNNMEVEVSKLMVSGDSTSQQKSLSFIKQQTSDAENSLSSLPINNEVLGETSKFMNELNGYCTSLITYKEGKLEENDVNTLNKVHRSLVKIKAELNEIMDKIMSGYKITEHSDIFSDSGFSKNFSGFNADTLEIPSLIYDGPFSSSTYKKQVKGLKNIEIGEEEGEKIIENILKDNITGINRLGETKGNFETFDYGVNTKNRDYFVQITKKGGFLLNMTSNISSKEEAVDDKTSSENIEADTIDKETERVKKGIDSALEFAKKLNIENLNCVWSAYSNEVAYINLAPSQDDIVLYPDLIKAKVDLETNEVVGWEASSYAYNHTEREDLIPQLDLEDAKKLVSPSLKVEKSRLCVIPLDYVGETLAYEFSGTFDTYKYYLYIDAYTGSQVRVLRVIQTNEGELIL